MAKRTANKKGKRLRVGNRVKVPYGTEELEAVVVEDRGNLGVGGRQIVRVRLLGRDEPAQDAQDPPPPADPEEGSLELPAENMTLIE
jgi:hypothetical protein